MKTKKVLTLLSVVSGMLALPLASPAQFLHEFLVVGLPDPATEGDVPGGDPITISAKVVVDFGGSWTDKITVQVTNLGDSNSDITGFYLRKPADYTDNTGLKNTGDAPVSNPADWGIVHALPNFLKEYGEYNADIDDYFGAEYGTALRFPSGPTTGTFIFLLEDVISAEDWLNDAYPMVYVRWQSVGDDRKGSGKGYGGTVPPWEPVIPEPSAVAAMAVLGMGGLLLVRRRLTRKG